MSSIYIHSRNQSHSSKCALHTRQESLLELYLLIQSLKEAIHSKCNLKVHYGTFSHLPLTYWVHVKFHRKKSVSGYTDYTKAFHNFYWKQEFSGSVPSHLHSIYNTKTSFKRFSLESRHTSFIQYSHLHSIVGAIFQLTIHSN